jgi:hypothetical protein
MVWRGDLSDIAGPLIVGAWLVPIPKPYSLWQRQRAFGDGKRGTVTCIGQLGVELVKDIITTRSKIGDKAAGELAVQVLQALNSIPEKIR